MLSQRETLQYKNFYQINDSSLIDIKMDSTWEHRSIVLYIAQEI